MIKHPNQPYREKDMPKWVWECVPKAWKWICNKYGYDINAQVLPAFRFSYSARFACFYDWHTRYFPGRTPHIRLRKSTFWRTYKRKTVGKYSAGIQCSKRQRLMLSLVHELTHYIQHLEDRNKSEVETTRNEIEFAKEYYPQLYHQLKTID